MNRYLVLLVGVGLTVACLLLYAYEPPFITRVANATYDALLKHVHKAPQSGRIAIVDLDESSLAQYGQWPWPRYLVAQLTRRILDAGASVVAFDIVFAEEDRTSPLVLQRAMKKDLGLDTSLEGIPEQWRSFDRLFADALGRGRTILGCYMHPTDEMVAQTKWPADEHYRGYFFTKGTGPLTNYLFRANGITISIPLLNQAAGNSAFFNTVPDFDNIIRGSPLIWSLGPKRIYPSLALEALRMDRQVAQVGIEYGVDGIAALRLKDLRIPTDLAGRIVVNYRSPLTREGEHGFTSFPSYPAAEVIAGQVGAEALSNKIVFVGTSAPGLRDLRTTPLTDQFSGVEIHATVVDNILAGDILLHPAWIKRLEVITIFIAGLLLTLLIHRGKSWICFLGMVAAILGVIETSVLLMQKFNFVFVPAWIIISVLLIYLVLTMIKYWQEERQKRWVRNLFSAMVSPAVLRHLEADPASLSLTGRKVEATMFFSDLAGLTRMSEALAPERLLEILNQYLSPMSQIIMERGGYVDKYEGDLIMAEWGVPFPAPDHAVQACLAALEQQERLADLRPVWKDRFGYELHARMGLNSGLVTAGNTGSEERKQYTVLGDAVNQAARFEPLNKFYQTRIIIGGATFEGARNAVEARLLDRIVVVGRTEPVVIYELLARKGGLSDEVKKAMDLYEEALRLHWERQWQSALDRLDQALGIVPEDGPSRLLRARALRYQTSAPPANWTGEWRHTEKE